MIAPTAQVDPQEQDDPVVAAVKLMKEHGVPLPEIEAYVAKKRGHSFDPTTTRHDGTPFVDATPDTSETLGDRASGAISAAYNGLTLGQGNKLIAALRTAAAARGGGHLNYGDELNDQNAVLDDYTRRRPVAAAALEVAGSLPTMTADLPLAGVSAARSMLNVAKGAPQIAEHLPVVGRVIRTGKTLERLAQRFAPEAAPVADATASARPALRLVPREAPAVEGLQSPMESLEDIVNSGRVEKGPQSLDELVSQPTLAPTRHRTAAQFDNFAQRLGNAPQPSSLDKQLHDLVTPMRQRQPLETGNAFGDAEVAQGLDQPQPDLEDQLRRSLAALGKKPPRP